MYHLRDAKFFVFSANGNQFWGGEVGMAEWVCSIYNWFTSLNELTLELVSGTEGWYDSTKNIH